MYKSIFINDFADSTTEGILDTYNVSDCARALVGKIIFADYTYEDYSGSSIVVFESVDGELYEVNGSHCSCFGLEDQWEPEPVSIEYYKERLERGVDVPEQLLEALGIEKVQKEEDNSLILEDAKAIIHSYTRAKRAYEDARGKMTDEHAKAYAKLIAKEFGEFALVVRGYTPSFNDGDECRHSFDYSLCTEKEGYGFSDDELYLEIEYNEDWAEFFEYDSVDDSTINTKFKGNELFHEVINEYADFLDDINETNYEVRVKFKDGELTFINDYYDCGY